MFSGLGLTPILVFSLSQVAQASPSPASIDVVIRALPDAYLQLGHWTIVAAMNRFICHRLRDTRMADCNQIYGRANPRNKASRGFLQVSSAGID